MGKFLTLLVAMGLSTSAWAGLSISEVFNNNSGQPRKGHNPQSSTECGMEIPVATLTLYYRFDSSDTSENTSTISQTQFSSAWFAKKFVSRPRSEILCRILGKCEPTVLTLLYGEGGRIVALE